MSSPHVPLPRDLRLPREFDHVPGYLALVDPDLRLRRSVDRPGTFVLERRVRQRPVIHCGHHNGSDFHVQARDGYIHVARTNAAWLQRPWNIVRALKVQGEDLFVKGAKRFASELDYEDAWRQENAARQRRDDFRGRAREMFDLLDRMGNRDGTERTRFNNVGMPKAPALTRQQRRAQTRGVKKHFAKARRRRAERIALQ